MNPIHPTQGTAHNQPLCCSGIRIEVAATGRGSVEVETAPGVLLCAGSSAASEGLTTHFTVSMELQCCSLVSGSGCTRCRQKCTLMYEYSSLLSIPGKVLLHARWELHCGFSYQYQAGLGEQLQLHTAPLKQLLGVLSSPAKAELHAWQDPMSSTRQ